MATQETTLDSDADWLMGTRNREGVAVTPPKTLAKKDPLQRDLTLKVRQQCGHHSTHYGSCSWSPPYIALQARRVWQGRQE